jgi:hypothetical protein
MAASKKKGEARLRLRLFLGALRLEGGYGLSLQALGARANLEFNRLAFVQRLVALRLNRGVVDENVLAGLALDETEALAGVKPLYCSLFFHFFFLFFLLSCLCRSPFSRTTKKAASLKSQPL